MTRMLLLTLTALLPATVFAQSLEAYQQRQADLSALASIFGELHHIRRTCEPRHEADIWRERMKKLIELEDPPQDPRVAMSASFNRGYNSAVRRFPSCNRRARDYAAARAATGDALIKQLSQSLQ